MDLILAAHGTRRPGGVAMIGDLAAQVSGLLDRRVQVAFVDVLGPTPSEVLSRAATGGRPAVVVPAFLSRGYHVRTDLPAHVTASGHPNVIVAPALGPSGEIARIVAFQDPGLFASFGLPREYGSAVAGPAPAQDLAVTR